MHDIRIRYRFEVGVLGVVSCLIGITMGVNVYFAIGSLVGLLSAISAIIYRNRDAIQNSNNHNNRYLIG